MSTTFYQKARRHLGRKCPVMKTLIAGVGPCTLVAEPADPFTILVRCVVYQQISTKAARSIFDRVSAATGGPGVPMARLAKMTEAELRACGVSGPKQRTLRAVVDHVAAHPDLLPGIADRDDDAVRAGLTAIKGIGPWSADMFLIFGLARPDVLPVGDYGLRAGVRNLYGLKELPGAAELEEVAAAWRPYRSVATWYVWRSLGPVPQSGQGG
ncbi:MAG: DNA-3-methyladenine glycosylase [Isosphaera sp.]|nr:DNA-3-methyladenine glycosylase [Isosphaera sp.]